MALYGGARPNGISSCEEDPIVLQASCDDFERDSVQAFFDRSTAVIPTLYTQAQQQRLLKGTVDATGRGVPHPSSMSHSALNTNRRPDASPGRLSVVAAGAPIRHSGSVATLHDKGPMDSTGSCVAPLVVRVIRWDRASGGAGPIRLCSPCEIHFGALEGDGQPYVTEGRRCWCRSYWYELSQVGS